MNRACASLLAAGTLAAATIVGSLATVKADDAETRDIPAAFAPFEYLLGKWSGRGVQKDDPAQRFRGWDEKHSWAWIFKKGQPVGLAVSIEGGKLLATGKLTFDPEAKHYRLEGTGPKPKAAAVVYEGTIDRAGRQLTLSRVQSGEAATKDASDVRIVLWPNANFVRYTMTEEVKEPGSIQYKRAIEVGLTREGESLAGGATSSERPRCIVTGGAASMTVMHDGKSYPICCSGCQEEFKENPEKYIKKAALMLSSQAGKARSAQSTASKVSRFEDAFAGDVVDTPAEPASKGKSAKAAPSKPATAEKAKSSDETADDDEKPAAKPAEKTKKKAAPAKSAARAATLLRLGRSSEKDGKIRAALGYYRQIVDQYPTTPSAKTAAERIKALEKE